ncbi:kelch-like protein 25 [Oculina patagonica]
MHRQEDEDREVTLVAENGKEFKAYMHVLSEASPFFENLFNSNMKESIEGVVRLEILTESQMADILEFIFTGNIQILTQEKAEELIQVADYLCLESLKSVAQKFLEQKLSFSNCISYYNMAEKYMCEELIASCRKFITLNFITFAESEDFLTLSNHEVEKWISNDDIVINEEEDVFKILLKWINQDKSQRGVKFAELFRHVRLTCMSRDFLVSDVVTNDLVNENENCRDSVAAALKWVDRSSDCHVPRPHPPRKVHESCVVVACPISQPLNCFCYIPDKDQWCSLPKIPWHDEADYFARPWRFCIQHLVTYRGQLFAIVYEDIYKSQCYDPDMNQWYPAPWANGDPNQILPVIENKQTPVAVVVVNDEMCFISKFNQRYKTLAGKLYKYNFASNSISSSLDWVSRPMSCVIAYDTYIYVIGGYMLSEGNLVSVSEAARFDTVENKWEKIADIQEARYNAFGVAANKKIFIAGGVGNLKRTALKTCEVYNMLTDEWQFMACLTGAHHLRPRRQQGNLFLVNETLYVLGEFWLGDCIVTVECYDDEKQKWNAKTCIQIHKSILAYKASSLNIFKGSLNNLKAVVSDIGLQNMYLAEFNYKYEPQ